MVLQGHPDSIWMNLPLLARSPWKEKNSQRQLKASFNAEISSVWAAGKGSSELISNLFQLPDPDGSWVGEIHRWSHKIGKRRHLMWFMKWDIPDLWWCWMKHFSCSWDVPVGEKKKLFSFSGVMDIAAIGCHKSYRLQKAMIISLFYFQVAWEPPDKPPLPFVVDILHSQDWDFSSFGLIFCSS